MLKLHINPSETGTAWSWTGNQLRSGATWLEPFDHPALDCVAATSQQTGASIIAVRELPRGHDRHSRRLVDDLPADRFQQLKKEVLAWPLDFTAVEIAPDRTVAVTAGECGTAPIYLAAHAGRLRGSWTMADVVRHLPTVTYDVLETARLLALWFRYSHRTCFSGLYRVTERATARFDGRSLTLTMPAPAAHSQARILADGADVLGAYERMLDGVIDQHTLEPSTTCTHLSGGMDSAVTGTHLALRYPDSIAAAAMLLPGPQGVQQRVRRAEIVRRAGFRTDITTEAAARPPLHPTGARALGHFVNPYEEPYHEATASLVDAMVGHGTRTVVTGIGGDEMLAPSPAEVPREPVGPGHIATPWLGPAAHEALAGAEAHTAPPTVVNEMTLLAMASAAPLLLHAGIWPLHPFADPAMVRFGEWLPYEWRSRKTLHRRRLAALGMSHHVVHPPLPENFTPVMQQSIRTTMTGYLARLLADGSPLIEAGLIDPDALGTALDRIRNDRVHDADDRLADVVAADLAFRAACSPTPPETTCT